MITMCNSLPYLIKRITFFILLSLYTVGIAVTNGAETENRTKQSITNCVTNWSDQFSNPQPVPLGNVEIKGFLGQRRQKNLESLLAGSESPLTRLSQCKEFHHHDLPSWRKTGLPTP